MSEIEKMYMRCKIKKQQICSHSDTCYNCSLDECEGCNAYQYPPFTAEKQLELIKLLMKQEDFSWTIQQQGKDTKYVFYVGYEYGSGDFKEFTEALAGIINDLWAMQYLTEEEKQQVKGILE